VRVIATVDSSGQVSIFDVAPGASTPAGSTPGSPYLIELREANGTVLSAAAPLTTTVHVDGVAGQRPPMVLEATLPELPGTAAVVVSAGGQDLARRNRSAQPPTVTITSPRPGSGVGARATTVVRWVARDADGDPLTAAVDYSPDGGRTWKVVADQVQGNEARVPSRELSASRAGRFRVGVSDGFDVAAPISGPLRVAGAPPTVRITGPVGTGTVRTDQMLLLSGEAFDDAGRASVAGSWPGTRTDACSDTASC
jgi:hypothetical protein